MLSFIGSRRISMVLAGIGLIISTYLTWIHITNSSALCTGIGGCDAVQNSIYSEIAGVPVALLGLFAYLGILALHTLEEVRGPFTDLAPHIVLGLSLIGVLYSIYLTYMELFVILAICPYCVASAILIAGVFGLAVYRSMNIPLSD